MFDEVDIDLEAGKLWIDGVEWGHGIERDNITFMAEPASSGRVFMKVGVVLLAKNVVLNGRCIGGMALDSEAELADADNRSQG